MILNIKANAFIQKWITAALALILCLFAVLSLRLGRYPVSFSQIVHILFMTTPWSNQGSYADAPWVIIEIVRIPRILLVVLCGMGLSMSGAAMQGIFHNPLVGPEIAGVSAGAACGGALAILIALPAAGVLGMAFGGGILALGIAFALAMLSRQASILALVLSGVIVGSFFSAVVGVIEMMADPMSKLPSILYWLLGSFTGSTYEKVTLVAMVMLVCGSLLMALRWRINLLSLGDEDAASLGVNCKALRLSIAALVALIVAAQVSVSGGVGWVGLIIPHCARMLVGSEHRRLLPISALLGGVYLLAMDDLARSIGHQEIPIGLLTSLVGAPCFAILFWKTQGRGWS